VQGSGVSRVSRLRRFVRKFDRDLPGNDLTAVDLEERDTFGNKWDASEIALHRDSIPRPSQPVVVVAVDPLFARVPTAGLLWLLAGGLFYTAGVAFYATDSRLRFGHLIWHLFVMAGTTCHYFAVLWYAA